MKQIYLFILSLLLPVSFLFAQSGGNSATAGKEFYITFGNQNTTTSTLQLKVVVEEACYITAKYNNQTNTYWNNWNNTWVTPGIYTQNVSNDDVINTNTGITPKTITLTSTENVCVYAINYRAVTSDATCILPVSTWGTAYRLATGLGYRPYYAVVAKEDNTDVTIHDNTIQTLNKNGVYHYYFPSILNGLDDMTGEKITSTKPVALFSGAMMGISATLQHGLCPEMGLMGSGDHTYEQLWSIDKWGKDFFAFPISTPTYSLCDWGGLLALVADEDETTITLSGGINDNYTLNAGEKQYVCHVMSGLTRIVSDKPIMVFLMLPDATVTNIVPAAQRIKRATVAPFILTGNTNINQHGIDMLVPAAQWNETVIKENGAVVPNTTYTVSSSVHFPDWYHIRKNLPNEDVTIDITCHGGFLAYMSGCGSAESYAFVAGTGAYDLQNYFTIQEKATDIDTHYENTTTLTHTFNAGDIIVVKRTIEKNFDAVEWLINGISYTIEENLSSMNTLNFPASALASGENSLTMAVRYAGATQDSLYMGKVWLLQNECLDLQITGVSSEGCLELEWKWHPPAPTGTYGFTLYQWGEAIGEWQTASTNYDKTIKVLNVYPDIAGSNTLQGWMNNPAIGLGKIIVTPVSITGFNNNPNSCLKEASGEYIYDAIMFGSWDSNNSKDLSSAGEVATREFLNSGRGVIFGHDTQRYGFPNFNSLTDKTNLDVDPVDPRNHLWRGSTNIKVVNDGFLLKYPHIIPYETTLTIPYTHTTGQLAKGVIWMNFPNVSGSWTNPVQEINGGTNDFYLTTWNNAAMIQTGHSNGTSTLDERKVIANILWYVAQFTTDTTAKICSALDLAPPDVPTVNRYDCTKIDILSNDNGTPYIFYVKATNTTNYADTCTSNILDAVNKSGLKGFYILEDNDPNGIPEPSNLTTQFIAAKDNQWVTYKQSFTNYVHIRAIDSAGNLSNIVTLDPPDCAEFYANSIRSDTLQYVSFCNRKVVFHAEINGEFDSLKWYIKKVEDEEYEEYKLAENSLDWSGNFETGEYNIKMEVYFETGEPATLVATLRMVIQWIKIKNVRY